MSKIRKTSTLLTELLDDSDIFIPVKPDFMDHPSDYSLSMFFPANRDFYRNIRDLALSVIISICLTYGYTDYIIITACSSSSANASAKHSRRGLTPSSFIDAGKLCNTRDIATSISSLGSSRKKIKAMPKTKNIRDQNMDDFIIMQSTDYRKCIENKCPCINAGLIFLFKLRNHINEVLTPQFDSDEARFNNLVHLAEEALSRILPTSTPKAIKKLHKKHKDFSAQADVLNAQLDIDYFKIELIKRIYLRELNKIISCYY